MNPNQVIRFDELVDRLVEASGEFKLHVNKAERVCVSATVGTNPPVIVFAGNGESASNAAIRACAQLVAQLPPPVDHAAVARAAAAVRQGAADRLRTRLSEVSSDLLSLGRQADALVARFPTCAADEITYIAEELEEVRNDQADFQTLADSLREQLAAL
jgi:hypothetical protein